MPPKNVMVTDLEAVMVTVQVLPETASQPVQEAEFEADVELGVAVNVTTVPPSKASVQVPDVQEIVPGTDATRPPPLPFNVTASG